MKTTMKTREWRRWAVVDDKLLSALYRQTPAKEVAARLDRSVCAVRSRAEFLGVCRLSGWARQRFFNEAYFERLNTASKAYWLGFLWADGSVSTPHGNSYAVTLSLKWGDRSHLGKLLSAVSAIGARVGRTKRGLCQLKFYSKRMFLDLCKYGVVPRKSYAGLVPRGVPRRFVRHFLRGVFDGDGSVYGKGSAVNVSITGQKVFLVWVKEFMKMGGVYKTTRSWRWVLGGRNQVGRFYRSLYLGSSVWLDRKRVRFVSELG